MAAIDPKSHEDLGAIEYPSPEIVECPYPFYGRLRDEAPIHRLPNGDFLVSRWEDIVYVARNPELFSNDIIPITPGFSEIYRVRDEGGKLTPWPMAFTDPPEHKLKRSLGLSLVSRERLRTFEPMIREIADELIDRFVGLGEVEFRSAFGDQLPSTVILRACGVPREDEEMVRGWLAASQGQGFRRASEEQQQRHREGREHTGTYLRRLLRERYDHPGDDFLSAFVHAQAERDGQLDMDYLVAEVTTLFSAANHNTTYMLANTLLLLLENPEQLNVVLTDRSLLRPMIDEGLRVESPVQWLQRVVVEDTEIRGVPIPKGSVLLLLWGSGNRDERTFEDPERFWVERPGVVKTQLGFGQGLHMCVGAPLARLEGSVAFEQLLTRLPNLRLSDKNDGTHFTTVNHRAPKTLWVDFDPPA